MPSSFPKPPANPAFGLARAVSRLSSRSALARRRRPFLRRNESWVLAQVERVSSLRALRRPAPRQPGEILYRGESTLVRVEIAETKALGNLVRWSEGEIIVRRGLATRTSAARGLENWLRQQARSAIVDCLPELTERIRQRPGRVYVMDQRTKWGSCSSRGNLSFNWRLILAPEFVRRYLVTHEVVHLAVPDHSPKFWLTLQSLCPEMERAKQWLSRYHAQLTVNLASIVGSGASIRDAPRQMMLIRCACVRADTLIDNRFYSVFRSL